MPRPRAELHNPEAIFRIEVVENVEKGRSGLLELFPLHAAGGVQHHDHVLGNGPFGVFNPGCGQHHEVPLAHERIVGAQDANTDVVHGGAVEQLKVGGWRGICRLMADLDVVVIGAVNGDVVAWGVDGPDRNFGRNGDLD